MSGHNKWSSIKHKKGAADKKRAKLFTKLIKEITVAARQGGGDETSNPRLRTAVAAAKAANMPTANVDKAIKRGTGETDGVNYEEIVYEGYGQAGVAIIVECLTDNRNRTVADVRHIFSKYGGNLAESGAVAWVFDSKGEIVVKCDLDEDEFMLTALDCGAEDIEADDGEFLVYTDSKELHTVVDALKSQGLDVQKFELTKIPKNTVNADDVAEGLLNLIDKLEDCDDVQKVYANFEISDEVLEKL